MNSAESANQPKTVFDVSHRMVLGLAVPMTLAYLSTPLLGVVDTAVVGQFGNAALIGGLAVGAIIIDLLFTTFNFLRSGTTGLVSQAFGAGDEKEKQAILFRALVIAIVAGLIAILLSPLLLELGLWFMNPGNAVSEATSEYFLLRMLSAPLALGNYVILGWLLGLGKSWKTLALQLLLNGTNIALSIFLGLTLDWGLSGVAVATIIGEALAFVVGLMICWRELDHSIRPSKKRLLDSGALTRLVNLNADIMIRSFALLFAFAWFTKQGAGFGETTLAANAVLMHFFLVAGYFLDGLATAAEQICGRSIGANSHSNFWKGFRLTLFWNLVMAVALTSIYLLVGDWMINLMTTDFQVRSLANAFLLLAAITPLTGVFAFQLDGVFIGATWSREMSRMMIISLASYFIALWLLKEPYGNIGLWLALHCFLLVRGLALGLILPYKARAAFS